MDLPDDLELPLASGAAYWYWLGGRPSVDLVNTLRERWWRKVETLVTEDDLLAWLGAVDLVDSTAPTPTSSHLRDARELREAIDSGIEATLAGEPPPAAAVATINAHLPAASLPLVLEAGSDGSVRLVSAPSEDPVAYALGRVAADAAKMLGSEERARARICASETCSARFFDHSPAGNRRWCSMAGCGNIAKARRHRGRARNGGDR